VPGLTRKKVVELLRSANVPRATKVRKLDETQTKRIRSAVDASVRAEAQSRSIQLVRLANRVPLQYQQSACAITKAVTDVNWRRYGLNQPRGGIPSGPMVLVVHIASVWVPFTSESKEAIAHYREIVEELQRVLQECGRELGRFLSRRSKAKARAQRRSKLDIYCGELVESLHRLTGKPRKEISAALDRAADHYAAVVEEA
jgi:DNA topoisomerase-6 subunit B